MKHKWKLFKRDIEGRILFGFEMVVDVENKAVTPVWEVEDGDEFSALCALCEYTKGIDDPLTGLSSYGLQNVAVGARRDVH